MDADESQNKSAACLIYRLKLNKRKKTCLDSSWTLFLQCRSFGQMEMQPASNYKCMSFASLFMKKVIFLLWHWSCTSQFDAGAHIQRYPWCPAEGQSLQRGHIWNMPVFSLMTHSTINTLQLSGSACGHGGVYWLLVLVPRWTLAGPADHLPDWCWRGSSLTHAQRTEGLCFTCAGRLQKKFCFLFICFFYITLQWQVSS